MGSPSADAAMLLVVASVEEEKGSSELSWGVLSLARVELHAVFNVSNDEGLADSVQILNITPYPQTHGSRSRSTTSAEASGVNDFG